jgi:hypothetical protein
MGEGTIAKLHKAGIHTIEAFVGVTAQTLIKSGEFTVKGAEKIIAERTAAFEKATIVDWAVGSGVFGRGIGTKRLEQAFALIPRDLVVTSDLYVKISAIHGWSHDSARAFIDTLPAFKAFMDRVKVVPKFVIPAIKSEGEKLSGQNVLFTGFHPKDLEAYVKKEGGQLVDSWSSKVTLLVIKDTTVENEKTKKATAASITIMTADQFRVKYGI